MIKRVCDQFDGTWFNGNKIPSCIGKEYDVNVTKIFLFAAEM